MPVKIITVQAPKQGLFEFTHQVTEMVREAQVNEGLCSLFVRHTSASLLIQENADRFAKRDLEHWLNRLVAEHDSLYTHTAEGTDDMPSHIKSALTATSLSIPILNGQLVLGTWQGIFLWEHRHHAGNRSVAIHIGE